VTAPRPPADIADRIPITTTVPTGRFVHRFFTASNEPLYFDRSQVGRLNAPDGTYGVLYAAKRPQGAFAETFLRQPGRTQLAADLIARKAYARIEVTRPLRLINLHGPGLARLGATAEVTHGGLPYTAPQAWSAAIHAHPLAADGIAYKARHDDREICYALFDRAAPALRELGRERDLDQGWFYELAEPYGVGIAPPGLAES